jgi:hypothetical protein
VTCVAVVTVVLLSVAGCGKPSRTGVGMNAPSPNGCYVKVYDGERFAGQGDFLNGPRRYATLAADLPNGASWALRIRSLQVGPAATVTVWADTDFRGRSMEVGPDRAFPTLGAEMSGEIESIVVACTPAANGPSV